MQIITIIQARIGRFFKIYGIYTNAVLGIVERFWNREIFEKINGIWKLKDPIYKDLKL